MNQVQLQVPDDVRETALEQVVDSGETAGDGNAVTGGEGATQGVMEGPDGETTKLPGIDQVLKEVREQFGDGHFDVIRGLQKDFSQSGEVESLRRQLKDAISEVEGIKTDMYETSEEGEDPLSDVPEEQLQLLELALERGGYVKKDDLDAQEVVGLVNESNETGIEKFGNDFGSIDEITGEFSLNPQAKDRMAPVYDRIKNQDALTFFDLHILSNFDDIVANAFQQGVDNAVERLRAENSERVGRAVRGNVANTSAGGLNRPEIYNREELKGASLSKRLNTVMENALKVASSS